MPKRKQGSSALAELQKNRAKKPKVKKKKKLKVKKKDKPRKKVSKAAAKRMQEHAQQESAAASAPCAGNSSSPPSANCERRGPVQVPVARTAEETQRLKQLGGLARLTLGAQVHKSLPACHGIAGKLPVGKCSPTLAVSVPLSGAAFAVMRDGLLAATPGFGQPHSQHGSGLQPYLSFCQEQRAEIGAGSSKKLGNAELARRWKALDDGAREAYKGKGTVKGGGGAERVRVRINTAAALQKFLGPGSIRRESSGFRSFAGQVAVCSVVQLPCTLEFLPAKSSDREATFGDSDNEHDTDDADEPGRLVLRYTHTFEMKLPRSMPSSVRKSDGRCGSEGESSGAAGGDGGGSSDTCAAVSSAGTAKSQDY